MASAFGQSANGVAEGSHRATIHHANIWAKFGTAQSARREEKTDSVARSERIHCEQLFCQSVHWRLFLPILQIQSIHISKSKQIQYDVTVVEAEPALRYVAEKWFGKKGRICDEYKNNSTRIRGDRTPSYLHWEPCLLHNSQGASHRKSKHWFCSHEWIQRRIISFLFPVKVPKRFDFISVDVCHGLGSNSPGKCPVSEFENEKMVAALSKNLMDNGLFADAPVGCKTVLMLRHHCVALLLNNGQQVCRRSKGKPKRKSKFNLSSFFSSNTKWQTMSMRLWDCTRNTLRIATF